MDTRTRGGDASVGLRLRALLVPTVRPTDLARQAGVSRQYVYAVLSGKRPPSRRLLEAAAELGLPVDLILGTTAQKSAKPAFGRASEASRDQLDDANGSEPPR